MSADRLTAEQLQALAVDSFDVMNCSRRMGLKREAQVAELVKTFEVRLGYREAKIDYGAAAKGMGLTSLEMAQRIVKGEL